MKKGRFREEQIVGVNASKSKASVADSVESWVGLTMP